MKFTVYTLTEEFDAFDIRKNGWEGIGEGCFVGVS